MSAHAGPTRRAGNRVHCCGLQLLCQLGGARRGRRPQCVARLRRLWLSGYGSVQMCGPGLCAQARAICSCSSRTASGAAKASVGLGPRGPACRPPAAIRAADAPYWSSLNLAPNGVSLSWDLDPASVSGEAAACGYLDSSNSTIRRAPCSSAFAFLCMSPSMSSRGFSCSRAVCKALDRRPPCGLAGLGRRHERPCRLARRSVGVVSAARNARGAQRRRAARPGHRGQLPVG